MKNKNTCKRTILNFFRSIIINDKIYSKIEYRLFKDIFEKQSGKLLKGFPRNYFDFNKVRMTSPQFNFGSQNYQYQILITSISKDIR